MEGGGEVKGSEVFIVVGMATLLILGCSSGHVSDPALTFSHSECDQALEGSHESISRPTWVDSSTVEVSAVVIINCAEDILWGDIVREDGTIVLQYKSSRCRPCAECICPHELTYRITGVQRRDIAFRLEEVR